MVILENILYLSLTIFFLAVIFVAVFKGFK